MSARRTYNDLCGIARALDAVGERWALLVVRELLLGPKRFTDLRTGLPNVGPDVLAQRLRELEAAGLLRRRTLPPPAGARVYELTERGAALETVILELGRWGSEAPVPSADARLGIDSAVVALKTLFHASVAARLTATWELRLDEQPFTIQIEDGSLQVERGEAPHADASLATDPGTLAQLLWQGRTVAEAERAGDATAVGSRRTLTRLLRLFPLES